MSKVTFSRLSMSKFDDDENGNVNYKQNFILIGPIMMLLMKYTGRISYLNHKRNVLHSFTLINFIGIIA